MSKQPSQFSWERKPTEARHTEIMEENAVEDMSDADEVFVSVQRRVSQRRRLEMLGGTKCKGKIEKRLPFKYSPFFRPLSISDIEACIALENAAFVNEDHRCTPEKFKYRLSLCPELTQGIFCTVPKDDIKPGFKLATLSAAKPVETRRPNHAVSALIAHIISTKTTHCIVEDSDMDFPRDWETSHNHANSNTGHRENGRTICLHSLAVVPSLSGCGLGSQIMKSYLEMIRKEDLADRVALLCQYHLVSYYEKFGFEHLGKSKATFSGGEWHDMIFKIKR